MTDVDGRRRWQLRKSVAVMLDVQETEPVNRLGRVRSSRSPNRTMEQSQHHREQSCAVQLQADRRFAPKLPAGQSDQRDHSEVARDERL